MKGYKIFEPDWTCYEGLSRHDSQTYRIGETYEVDAPPVCYETGFNFYTILCDCFLQFDYTFNMKNTQKRIVEIEALGDIVKHRAVKGLEAVDTLHCTNKIRLIREIPWEEALKMINAGTCNTGRGNTGNLNTMNYNTGNLNAGSHNSGSRNTGDWNSGEGNTGAYNKGSWNTGDWNTGNHNAGSWNTTDYASGFFNTKPGTIRMFNKPTSLTMEEWTATPAYKMLANLFADYRALHLIYDCSCLPWVAADEMSPEEKVAHPEYKAIGGYEKEGSKLSEKPGFAEYATAWWVKMPEDRKDMIRHIPNFDAKIFSECLGIPVELLETTDPKKTVETPFGSLLNEYKALCERKNNRRKALIILTTTVFPLVTAFGIVAGYQYLFSTLNISHAPLIEAAAILTALIVAALIVYRLPLKWIKENDCIKEMKAFLEQSLQQLGDVNTPAAGLAVNATFREKEKFSVEKTVDMQHAPDDEVSAVGVLRLTPLSNKRIMTSMTSLSNGSSPRTAQCIEVRTPLPTEGSIRRWNALPKPKVMQLPCFNIVLFKKFGGNRWSYLLPATDNRSDVVTAIDVFCRTILLYTINRKLQHAIATGCPISDMNDLITAKDLIPFFNEEFCSLEKADILVNEAIAQMRQDIRKYFNSLPSQIQEESGRIAQTEENQKGTVPNGRNKE